ncbi:MAG: hypothetical protein WD534_08680 [Phycisphaeraceae bacterium]
MFRSFKQLDTILRGDATRMSALREGRIDVPVGGILGVVAGLGVIYGLCIGSFALFRGAEDAMHQLIASAVKLPLLFFLTLLITLPSLYVFNALVGSRLSIVSVLRLLVAMLGVMLAVLASLGPIVVFFSISTTSYPFMQLLNVVMATVAGVLGLAFLLRTLHRLVMVQEIEWSQSAPSVTAEPALATSTSEAAAPAEQSAGEATGAADAPEAALPSEVESPVDRKRDVMRQMHQPPAELRGALESDGLGTDRRARAVFRIWVVVFALIGAQMSWVLRPFIGNPGQPFTWFRAREGNFFLAVADALKNLLGM